MHRHVEGLLHKPEIKGTPLPKAKITEQLQNVMYDFMNTFSVPTIPYFTTAIGSILLDHQALERFLPELLELAPYRIALSSTLC